MTGMWNFSFRIRARLAFYPEYIDHCIEIRIMLCEGFVECSVLPGKITKGSRWITNLGPGPVVKHGDQRHHCAFGRDRCLSGHWVT